MAYIVGAFIILVFVIIPVIFIVMALLLEYYMRVVCWVLEMLGLR